MMALVNGGLSNNGQYEQLRQYLDVDSFIDYMIVNHYAGNTDWATHNWYASRKRVPGAGFQFVSWDAEYTIQDVTVPVNPFYVRVMEGKIRAQAETGIDGSYIDWTHIAEETSYDKYSRLGFIDYLKKNLPPEVSNKKYDVSDFTSIKLPEKRGDKFWMEWITYRGYQVAEFHKHMRDVARQYNPNFMISGNVFGGFGYGPIAYLGAGNMEMLARDGYDDFIYSEMQQYLDSAPRNKDGIKITNSPALKYLTAVAHGKPVSIYATEITPPIFPDPTEKCLSAMSQINIAEAMANHCIFREKRETPPGATEIYKFLAENRQFLTTSVRAPRVLAAAAGRTIERARFASALFDRLEDALDSHAAGGFSAPRPRFDAFFRMLGQRVRIADAADRVREGEVRGVGADGSLRLGTYAGEERFFAGDVTLLKDEAP